jgi:hypothetical protein
MAGSFISAVKELPACQIDGREFDDTTVTRLASHELNRCNFSNAATISCTRGGAKRSLNPAIKMFRD